VKNAERIPTLKERDPNGLRRVTGELLFCQILSSTHQPCSVRDLSRTLEEKRSFFSFLEVVRLFEKIRLPPRREGSLFLPSHSPAEGGRKAFAYATREGVLHPRNPFPSGAEKTLTPQRGGRGKVVLALGRGKVGTGAVIEAEEEKKLTKLSKNASANLE